MKIRLNTWQKLFFSFIIVAIIPILIAGSVAIRIFYTGVGQQAEITLNLVIIAALSVGIAVLLAYFITQSMMQSLQANWEKKQELKKKLEEKLEEKERMRIHLLKKIIVSQEEERKRISRELHDETGQSLTSLMLGLRLIQQTDNIEKARELSKNLREIIYKTIEEIQWLSYELRPSALDDLGLDVALKRYVDELSQHANVDIEFEMFNCKGIRLSSVFETTVYRVVQEALTNVIRHASASKVKVMLQCDSKSMSAIIEDDGTGFNIESVEEDQQKSLGLFGMKERAVLVGGDLLIETAPGRGTRITLKIPLKEIEELNYERQFEKVSGEEIDDNPG